MSIEYRAVKEVRAFRFQLSVKTKAAGSRRTGGD